MGPVVQIACTLFTPQSGDKAVRTATLSGTRCPGPEPLWRGSPIVRQPHSKRRRTSRVGRGAAAVFLFGLMAGCVSASPPPSTAEVLDGQATAEARLAAIGRVEQWPEGLSVPGVKLVARQTYTDCRDGQNNWKVKDGYRLKCSAHSTVFLGWNGDYATGRDAMLTGMASFCAVTGLENVVKRTPNTSTVLGPNYSCPGGLVGQSQILSGHATKVLVTEESWGIDFSDQRRVAGPEGDALLEKLRSRRWLFAMDVSSVFYQDAP